MNKLTFMQDSGHKNCLKSDTKKGDNYQNYFNIDETYDFEPDYDGQAEMDEALLWGF